MSEIIDAAIDVFEKQIQALYTNDFDKFLSFMTPRIQKQLTFDIFQRAIELYKHTPIDIDAIDHEKSRLINEGESEEIPDKHIKLILVGSGRVLCHVVDMGGEWLIDDIYWRYEDSELVDDGEEEEVVEVVEEVSELNEDNVIIEETPIQTQQPISEQAESKTLDEKQVEEIPATDHEEEQLDE